MPDAIVTMFARDIQANLFPDNSFYKRSIDDSAMIDGEKVVLPISGSNPNVYENPTVFPLPVKFQEDDKKEYPIDEFVTEPIVIRRREEAIVNYAKRQNILRNHVMTLNTRIASKMAFNWAPSTASQIVRTSGTNRLVTGLPGATGNRKRVNKADFINVFDVMTAQDVDTEGREGLIPSFMYSDLLAIDEFIDYNKIGNTEGLKKGYIGMLLGFNIRLRSIAARYTNDGIPIKKLPTAAGAADDNHAAIFWHPQFVRRAEGSVQVTINPDQAAYGGGTVLGANVAAGGTFGRNDQIGVVALVQAAS